MLDMYAHSAFIQKAKENRTIVFLDLDRTIASSLPTPTEFPIRNAIRKLLEDMGAVVVFTTARAPEMGMSSGRFAASVALGFDRLPPLQGKNPDGTRYYIPLESMPEFEGVLDPDVIHSLGGGIRGLFEEGYMPDSVFNDYPGTSWRSPRLAIIRDLDGGEGNIVQHMPLIENLNNYLESKADVMPLPYRIQFDFSGDDALNRMVKVKQQVREALKIYPAVARRTKFVDESRPAEGKFCFYLLAIKKTKAAALEHIVRNIVRAGKLDTSKLNIFVAGDALTDLSSMFAGPRDCNFVYGLPSQAPVTGSLCYGNSDALFAGESIKRFTRRLNRSDDFPAGHFWFRPPGSQERRFIAGDLADPGNRAAASVLGQLAYFEETRR